MSPSTHRTHLFRDAALALSLLTVVPTATRWPNGERTGVAGWFPAVGLVLGGVAFGVIGLVPGSILESRGYLVAALVIAYFALITRFLHHDGLADVADAWWGGETTERRLQIMGDSATGAFGATALALTTALQVTAVGVLVEAGTLSAVLVVPAVARLAATCAAWLGSPAREGGLGRSVMGRPSLVSGAVVLVTLTATAWFGWQSAELVGVGLVGLGVVFALVVPHLIAQRMGGVTGDVMGASVLIVETILYTIAAIFMGVGV